MAHWKVDYKDIEFGDKLGEGNFGAVFKGEYIGTKVAIKKLFYVDDEFMQKYIEREMDTLTAIHHPNIVQLMGICIESDDVYIITEFINGGDLHKRLLDSSVKLGWPEKISYCRDIALAMTYLHSKGIMHRDLKSHNLLIGEGGKVKVCDFGLARSESSGGDDKNHQKTIVGTHEWMAPEIAMGQNYDKSADVFSFAMVMHEIISRGDPPPRKLVEGFQFKPEVHKPNIPSDTPAELWQILVECASGTPKDRPQFKDIVKRLSTLADAQPPPTLEEPKKDDGKSAEEPKKKKTKKKKSSDSGDKKKGEKTKKKKKKSSGDGDGKRKKSSDGDKKKGEKKKK